MKEPALLKLVKFEDFEIVDQTIFTYFVNCLLRNIKFHFVNCLVDNIWAEFVIVLTAKTKYVIKNKTTAAVLKK